MDPSKTKSFFEKPEGKTGILFGALILGALGYGLYVLLPFLIILFQNMIYAGALMALLATMVYLVLDDKVRTLVGYVYKSIMRAITGVFIEIDPIGILKSYIEDLKKRQTDMDKSIQALRGQKKKLETIMKENDREREHSLGLAGEAVKKGKDRSTFILLSRKAGRLQKTNMTFKSLYSTMDSLHTRLQKVREMSDFYISDIESEVESKTQERAMIMASHKAFSSARKILSGDASRKQIFDQTMEYLADDYAARIGDIEEFMDASKGFMDTVDLENGCAEAEALDALRGLDARIDKLLEPPKQRIASGLSAHAPDIVDADFEGEGVANKSSSFANLFGPDSKK